ncbi:MAG: alcohol dehydrogenase catalytic domain-containing protein [Myxococcota bacterium]
MQQLFCTGLRTLEWRETADPLLQSDDDAIVRPIAVARCEIDLPLLLGVFGLDRPFAIGHEAIGEIVALGDAVRGLEIGDRVAIAFQVSCGDCGPCGRGRSALCASYPTLSDYGMAPLSGHEYGGMLADLAYVPHAEAMLTRIPPGATPAALASLPDNVLDGYRTVRDGLATNPGGDVLVVEHGSPAIALYAVQSAFALGAERVVFAGRDEAALALAAKLGAERVAWSPGERIGRFATISDCGSTAEGFAFAVDAAAAGACLHSASYVLGEAKALPLGKLYTLGLRLDLGRADSAALLPEVMRLVADGTLSPGEITSAEVPWEDAARAWLEPGRKLVVTREEGRHAA